MAIPAIFKAASKVSSEVSKASSVADGNVESVASNALTKGVAKKFDPDKRIDTKTEVVPKNEEQSFNPDKRIESSKTYDDISERQKNCVNEFEDNREKYIDDSQAKGNYAEMKVDQDLNSKEYINISNDRVSDLETPTGPGIDGVYVNKENGNVANVEVKCNLARQGYTQDGKQMSSTWIDNRLDDAVGKEMADKIRMDSITNPDSVKSVLARVDLDGNISYFELNDAGDVIGGIDL